MLTSIGIGACVGVVAVAWVAGAMYNALRSPEKSVGAPWEQPPSRPGLTAGDSGLLGLAVAVGSLAVVGRGYFADVTVGDLWVRIFGLTVLVTSTAFTLWARFALGTMWSMAPRVTGDHQLRTRGPYAVTRHPIYTGFLGMFLGATLLSGIGQWIVLVPLALLVFQVKIRMEERLMVATFGDEYRRYRRQVPQLIPGLHALWHRHPVPS